jgi:hypothetical protein
MANTLPPDDDIPEFLKGMRFHPLAEMFPVMSPEGLDKLGQSISEVGLLEAITTKDGMVLDGRNRVLACGKIGRELTPNDLVELPAEIDPFLFVVSKNIERRHLTGEQKRDIVKALLARYPDYSSRWIADLARVSHHTVEGVRQESEGPAPASPFAPRRKGRDGKARKTRTPKSPSNPNDPTVRKKEIGDFIDTWRKFIPWQRRYFVKLYRDDIEAIIEELDLDKGQTGTEVTANA